MKPRIFINIHYLEIGGAETSLIGLLWNLNPQLVNVDLMMNEIRGELVKYIPGWVNVIHTPEAYGHIESPVIEALKNKEFGVIIGRTLAKLAYKSYVIRKRPKDGSAIYGYVGKYVTPFLPSLSQFGEYDLAISYLAPHNIVLDKIRARKKVCWIHTDYSKIDVNATLELPVWCRYDKIVSISPDVTRSFLNVFPSLKDKITEMENFLPIDLVKKRSEERLPADMPKNDGIINLLTIGRYSDAKRMDEIPLMAKALKDKGIAFKWYIIGYGNHRELERLHQQIGWQGVEDNIIILGKRENPYPYIKVCDIYVQPSRYEGKSITVREAQVLGKPVVITNYPTAHSQIEDGLDGFIGPYETEPFAKYLSDLILLHRDKLNAVISNLSHMDFSQKENLHKFQKLLPITIKDLVL